MYIDMYMKGGSGAPFCVQKKMDARDDDDAFVMCLACGAQGPDGPLF